MKTTTTTRQQVTMVLLTIAFTLLSVVLLANDGPFGKSKHYARRATMQKSANRASFATAYQLSASGHNDNYGFNFNVGNGSRLVEFGSMFDKDNKTFAGASIRYREYFLPNFSKASVYVQATAMYQHNRPLSDKLSSKVYDNATEGNVNTFNTLEAYAGIGFQQNLFSNFFVDFGIGVGGYMRNLANDQDFRKDDYTRFSADNGIGVTVKVSVGYYLW